MKFPVWGCVSEQEKLRCRGNYKRTNARSFFKSIISTVVWFYFVSILADGNTQCLLQKLLAFFFLNNYATANRNFIEVIYIGFPILTALYIKYLSIPAPFWNIIYEVDRLNTAHVLDVFNCFTAITNFCKKWDLTLVVAKWVQSHVCSKYFKKGDDYL